MAILFSNLNYTNSGRKRKHLLTSNRRKLVQDPVFKELQAPTTFRRHVEEHKSVDMAKARHDLVTADLAELEKRMISSNYTIAPAYNKGAYQVISRENVKDIGK